MLLSWVAGIIHLLTYLNISYSDSMLHTCHYLSVFFTSNSYHFHACRELNHCNICSFIGCILDNTKSALLYEYCTRGSLRDVLNNANFQFDWMFRLSFALDAAKGMSYLHSKKFIHGRLKSTTCVIDDQWTLRITGTIHAGCDSMFSLEFIGRK